jgi:hypothetical protein
MTEETLLVPKFKIVAGTPGIILSDTAQGADLKKWSMDLSGGNFRLRTLNDAESELVVPMTVNRTGYVGILKTPTEALDVNGNIAITGQIKFANISVDASNQLYKSGDELFFSRFNLIKTLNKTITPGSYAANTYFDLYSFSCVSIQGVFYITVVVEGSGYGQDYECILPVSYNMDWVNNYGISSPGANWFNLTPFIFTGRHLLTDSDEFRVQAKVIENVIYFRLLQVALPDGTPIYKVTIRHSNEFRGITVTELSSTGTDSGTFQTIPSVLSGNKDSTLFANNVGIATLPTIEKLTVGGSIKLTGSTPVIFNAGASLELRAGNGTSVGYDVNIGYGNYNGAKLNFWGGSTTIKMEVAATGDVYFAGYISSAAFVSGTAYKIGSSVGTTGQVIRSNGSTGGVWGSVGITEVSGFPDQTGNSGKFLTTNGSVLSWGTEGTVTSVAMSVPAGMSVSGSPITTSGTLAVTFDSQTANKFLASPAGTTGTPSFRSITSADISSGLSLSITGLTTSGVVAIATSPTIEKLTIGGSIRLDYPGSGPTTTIFCSNQTLELRAGNGTDTGYAFNIGYGNYNGGDLNFWGGSTGLKFQVSSAGVGFFAGLCGATYFQPTTGYKSVDGSTGITDSFTISSYIYLIKNGIITSRSPA